MVDTILSLQAKAKRLPASTKTWSHIFCDAMKMQHKREMRDCDLLKQITIFCDVHKIKPDLLMSSLIRRGIVKPIGRGWLELECPD